MHTIHVNYAGYQAFFNAERVPVPIKVLRSRNPALVLCFLQEAFKADHYSPTLTHERLTVNLADFLETWLATDDELPEEGSLASVVMGVEEKAEKLIKDWVREGYLTLYTNDQGDDLHSLTPDMETVLDWVASLMQKRSFVGTESRFLDILQKLRELVQNTSDDWRVKVAELEQQKLAIDDQIRQLTLTQTVQTFADYQVKERFQEVNVVARSLMRDFREVEDRFRLIAQAIYQKQSAVDQTKGGLLSYALDALDELRQTHEGRSFEGFYQHLTDPSQKAELDELIRRVFELLTERGLTPDDTFVRRIKFYLHTEGQKVNDSFYLLAQKLEKIIAEKHLRDRRKSLTLINEIRTLAFSAMDNPPRDDAFLEIDGKAEYLSSDSFVSLQERESRIEPRVLAVAETEEITYESLVNQHVIDKSVLLANVKYLLRSRAQVTLREVIDEFGLKYGLAELMAYGSLAAASTKHLINDTLRNRYMIGEIRSVEFPEIIFCR
ncbi:MULTISPECIES: DUF3375 family protein [unclassified Spirosoma]|uniref:DUF3375 family protein n=1 Tax=unclassified Spirosoma TaxID=2621999 RepID=UPI00095A82B1|nr:MULTISPECIES: DUF3375 family protein [unclassified Spirosoma]MBN8823355.1 DUF3375 family protein [Spirosoma sp.]OJW72508.1 MAG: hypothetical protein BGO59_15390 [Spirosoma sp. 48-14]